tara:strand:- start:235 stop:516 length:282 start_codon:yes stop_codon:yes gene_type:complete
MSVNLTAAHDKKKTRHLGKYWSSIDFELKERVNPDDFKYAKMKPVIGSLEIGGRKFDMTFSELNQLMRTCSAAMDQADKAYRMGKWGQAKSRY